MEVGPASRTMKKCHLPWSDFMVHGVNRPVAVSFPSFSLGPPAYMNPCNILVLMQSEYISYNFEVTELVTTDAYIALRGYGDLRGCKGLGAQVIGDMWLPRSREVTHQCHGYKSGALVTYSHYK